MVCQIVVSCTYEEGKPALMQDLNFLRQMIEDDRQFLEVTALGTELAWRVMKLWMKSAGRTLNNYQWRVVANAMDACTLPIFSKLVLQEVIPLAATRGFKCSKCLRIRLYCMCRCAGGRATRRRRRRC